MLHPEEDHHLLAVDDLGPHLVECHGALPSEVVAEVGLASGRRICFERGVDLGEDATDVTYCYEVWHDDAHARDEASEEARR